MTLTFEFDLYNVSRN